MRFRIWVKHGYRKYQLAVVGMGECSGDAILPIIIIVVSR